jgi:Mg2+-importing ATPase
MPLFPSAIIPRNILLILRRSSGSAAASPLILEASTLDSSGVFARMQSGEGGISEEEAERRLEEQGLNVIAQEQRIGRLRLFGHACMNPLVILLAVLAAISFATGDPRAGTVMVSMIVLGVSLRFVQESRADTAAAKLRAMISVTATVVREGREREIPLGQLVPGDVVRVAAGDMIPADLRLTSCKDLFLIQSSLTGESFPVEKFDIPENSAASGLLERKNICLLGTSVESGTGTGVILETGLRTYLGQMARIFTDQPVQTSFDKGVVRFTWLMIRFMLVMVPLVFLINGLTKHDWGEAFFFALAVAVGMTPEMLPMIVTVCLSRGAIAMSRKKVIVKRLNSIQNLGAMDVLCTDKTGTLTLDRVILEHYCDVVRREDESVLAMAYLNSYFQTGLKNVLDRAVLQHRDLREAIGLDAHRKIDEIPFDFSRKIMSVIVEHPEGGQRLICKGAPEVIFQRCTRFELDNDLFPTDPLLINDLREECDDLSADGFRVLAVAYKDLEPRPAYSKADECELVLKGYVAFLDPPKETAAPAIQALQNHGVSVKVLTGDNELVSRKICSEVGLPTERFLTGEQVEALSDAELAIAAEETNLFVRLSPLNKQRIINLLRGRGRVVGYLGDGINDSPAMRAADVGISVDTAVDIAKEAADIILLEKSLMVLEEGVLEGRKVYANILKYVRMGASSNFGNMFSVLGASAFLPFLPMKPMQILTNSLLYDFSQVPIPGDEVDAEQITRPRPWLMGEIARFILFIGPCSSIFDYTTYLMMLYLFGCWNNESLFQTGWFVESLLTQTLIIHIIRTHRLPFLQSRASWPLILTTMTIMAVGIWLPYSPLGPWLGFTELPYGYWPLLALTLLCYAGLTQWVKTWLLRKGWI